jgi:hypothetical protein
MYGLTAAWTWWPVFGTPLTAPHGLLTSPRARGPRAANLTRHGDSLPHSRMLRLARDSASRDTKPGASLWNPMIGPNFTSGCITSRH